MTLEACKAPVLVDLENLENPRHFGVKVKNKPYNFLWGPYYALFRESYYIEESRPELKTLYLVICQIKVWLSEWDSDIRNQIG